VKENYIAIYDESIRKAFKSHFDKYKTVEITDFMFIEHDFTIAASSYIISDLNWQKEYDKKFYAYYDPAYKAGFHLSSGFNLLSFLTSDNPIGTKILERKKKANISNGFVLIAKTPMKAYQLILSSKDDNLDIVNLMCKNAERFVQLFEEFKKITL